MSETIRNPSQREIEEMMRQGQPDKARILKTDDISEKTDNNKSSIPMKRSDDFEPKPKLFKLPSGRTTVNSRFLTENGEIFVRKLSLKEEGLFSEASAKKDFYTQLNDVLKNCIKTDLSITALNSIDKIPLIIFILAVTYGAEYDIAPLNGCSTCGGNTVTLNLLEDIIINYVPDDYRYPFEIDLSFSDAQIKLVIEYPRIGNETILINEANIFTQIKDLVVSIEGIKPNGKRVEKQDWDSIITYLEQEDKDKILDFLSEFGKFGIQMETDRFKCSKDDGTSSGCMMKRKQLKTEIDLEKIFSSIGDRIRKRK